MLRRRLTHHTGASYYTIFRKIEFFNIMPEISNKRTKYEKIYQNHKVYIFRKFELNGCPSVLTQSRRRAIAALFKLGYGEFSEQLRSKLAARMAQLPIGRAHFDMEGRKHEKDSAAGFKPKQNELRRCRSVPPIF